MGPMGEPVRLFECVFWACWCTGVPFVVGGVDGGRGWTRGLGGGRGVRRAFEGEREAPGGAWVWFNGMGE